MISGGCKTVPFQLAPPAGVGVNANPKKLLEASAYRSFHAFTLPPAGESGHPARSGSALTVTIHSHVDIQLPSPLVPRDPPLKTGG